MKCENYRELFSLALDNDLSPAEQADLERHLAGCIACREEFAAVKSAWDLMDSVHVPEPGEQMRAGFRAMLNNFNENEVEAGRRTIGMFREGRWSLLFPRTWVYPAVAALVCIILMQWFTYREAVHNLDSLRAEVHEMKGSMMLALLKDPSASERLRAVSYTDELGRADKEVVRALLLTLNNDPNVNVRLSTLEALSRLAADPEVRSGLVRSIIQQDSPILQAAIADVMKNLQEKRSVGSFRELLKQKDLDPGVRQKISETILQLI